MGNSCGKFLRENLAANCCGKILREIPAGNYYLFGVVVNSHVSGCFFNQLRKMVDMNFFVD